MREPNGAVEPVARSGADVPGRPGASDDR